MLSILIPIYNTICTDLVTQIHSEAMTLNIPFEFWLSMTVPDMISMKSTDKFQL
mgnify:CR=1 FL=1